MLSQISVLIKCVNVFKKPSLFTQSREEREQGTLMLVEPEALISSSFLCNSLFIATHSVLMPYQSAPAPLPLHALQKRQKGTNIYKTLQHAGSLPRDFPFVGSLNS